MRNTSALLQTISFPAIRRRGVTTLQVNLGYRCNQSCVHCHVAAGPSRTEEMDAATIDLVLTVLTRRGIDTLDLTGGAPELNPQFRRLVRTARALGVAVVDRCNLTILEASGQEDLAGFLAAEQVEIVASLPCYLEENVDRQRGKGVFGTSMTALRRLNALGYGRGDGLVLNLVFNPQGASLPPAQAALEQDYRRVLSERHGVVFDRLFVLANMPIQRFGAILSRHDDLDRYVGLLRDAHRDDNLSTVMCRDLVSVDWRGFLYDCDFNQMLDLPLVARSDARPHLRDLLDDDLGGHPIRVAGHCFACTAGQGSSCGGALTSDGASAAAE
ncbi:arsenosugar biosynthesis radical SAM (seleno)protein ArsS [Rhodoplanes roseus]|uniref:Radical SAM protein n=1 Tax=Rhodoplanes roseus TaxID=29409 RepID=A0A327L8A0_9BRAD|nr:arsenosugar biosynthesis radical SAM (seleno)protein ArsS [Rhodoplanes roseus]RAI46103.1 radical SAM protein [Rhodoplanes roseus]